MTPAPGIPPIGSEVARHLPAIAEACAAHGVRTLWLFGSATSDRFDPQRSDADFLVEFNGPDLEPWMKRYFELRRALEAILGRPYDLVPHDAVKGSYFRISPDTSRVPLYVAA